jgi:glycosyltransferase involved in cell wall biosynthesis
MDITVACDVRYQVTPDGAVWSSGAMAMSFWSRYLEVFDKVNILARGSAVPESCPEWSRVDNEQISLLRLPDYQGPLQYITKATAIRRAVRRLLPPTGALMLRVPSQIGTCVHLEALRTGRKFALEVVGDPYDVFAPGVVDHPLRPLLRWYATRNLKLQCSGAAAVSFVTQFALQKRYPVLRSSHWVSDVQLAGLLVSPAHYSSVELPPVAFSRERRHSRSDRPFQLVTVGSLAQLYKGVDVLIRALESIIRQRQSVRVVVVGDGKFRSVLESLAAECNVASYIEFRGHVSNPDVIRDILDESDLFVLPSRTEGLPRALLEAMARGLPCVASNVGGVPELLDSSDLVPANDVAALARRVLALMDDGILRHKMGMRNRAKAWEYREEALSARRKTFYSFVRKGVSAAEAAGSAY